MDGQAGRCPREHVERDDAGVGGHVEALDGLRPEEAVLREVFGQRHGDLGELFEPRVDEAPLERRDDDEIGGSERAGDDPDEHERDAGPNPARKPHSGRKR